MSITARKGSILQTFHLPPEPTGAKSKSYSRSKGNSESNEPAGLSERVKAFKAGDIVDLRYRTVNYRFVLENIAPYRMSASGRVTKLGKRKVRGVTHNAVYVRTPKKSLALIVATTVSDDSKSVIDTLESGQQVELAYRRQGGVLWLDEITRVEAVTGKPAR